MKSVLQQLSEMGRRVAVGTPLTEIDLYGLGGIMEVSNLKPEFLPGSKTISGSPNARKAEIFRLAEAYWSFKPQDWLNLENHRLQSARPVSLVVRRPAARTI